MKDLPHEYNILTLQYSADHSELFVSVDKPPQSNEGKPGTEGKGKGKDKKNVTAVKPTAVAACFKMDHKQ